FLFGFGFGFFCFGCSLDRFGFLCCSLWSFGLGGGFLGCVGLRFFGCGFGLFGVVGRLRFGSGVGVGLGFRFLGQLVGRLSQLRFRLLSRIGLRLLGLDRFRRNLSVSGLRLAGLRFRYRCLRGGV